MMSLMTAQWIFSVRRSFQDTKAGPSHCNTEWQVKHFPKTTFHIQQYYKTIMIRSRVMSWMMKEMEKEKEKQWQLSVTVQTRDPVSVFPVTPGQQLNTLLYFFFTFPLFQPGAFRTDSEYDEDNS